jgi:hypothetical protein
MQLWVRSKPLQVLLLEEDNGVKASIFLRGLLQEEKRVQ